MDDEPSSESLLDVIRSGFLLLPGDVLRQRIAHGEGCKPSLASEHPQDITRNCRYKRKVTSDCVQTSLWRCMEAGMISGGCGSGQLWRESEGGREGRLPPGRCCWGMFSSKQPGWTDEVPGCLEGNFPQHHLPGGSRGVPTPAAGGLSRTGEHSSAAVVEWWGCR